MYKGFILILCALALSILAAVSVSAEDLPIDIAAIGRREPTGTQAATRIGANLFTSDSQRVNEAFAEQIYIRQSVVSYLFSEAHNNYEVESSVRLMDASSNAGLFAQPLTAINAPHLEPPSSISIWVIVPIIAMCSIGGFILALISAKKKGQKAGVH